MNDEPPGGRYFIDAHGTDDDAVSDGFAWLLRSATNNPPGRGGVFVSSLRQVESLGRVIGADAADALRKDRQLQVDGVTIDLLIETGSRSHSKRVLSSPSG